MHKVETKDTEFVEKKGCITFSQICVNLGKVADLETGMEEYYCAVNCFSKECAKEGHGKLMPMNNPEEWKLRKLSVRELKALRDFKEKKM